MDLVSLLGDEASALLEHESKGIPKEDLHLPGPDFVERVFMQSDRNPQVLRNLQSLFDHGRMGGSGYVSILPVDQGRALAEQMSLVGPVGVQPQNDEPGRILPCNLPLADAQKSASRCGVACEVLIHPR